jgi:phenylacetate-CoA ligase
LYPITAFTGPCHGVLSESDRDLLWDAFGVPVYEQFLGLGNELLAQDCDVHEGLHIEDDCARFDACDYELTLTSLTNLAYPVLRLATGLRARIEQDVCACGRSGLKLYDLTALPQTLAAIA